MRKFMWRSLVALALCAPAYAEEPSLAPPLEVEVEVPPAEVDPIPPELELKAELPEDSIEAPPPEVEVEVVPVQIEPVSMTADIDTPIENIDSPDAVIVNIDVAPEPEEFILWTFGLPLQSSAGELGMNPISDEKSLNEIDLGAEVPIHELAADGVLTNEIPLEHEKEISVPEELTDPQIVFRNTEEEIAPNFRNTIGDLADDSEVSGPEDNVINANGDDVVTLSDTGEVELATMNTLGPGSPNIKSHDTIEIMPVVQTINLDRANTEFRNRTTALVGPPQTTVLRDSLITSEKRKETVPPTSPDRIHLLPPVEVIRLTDTQRDYARQMAEVDALRDQALKTGNFSLFERADAMAGKLRSK